MKNIKMVLAYDGTDFAGWQMQEKERTAQGELAKALEKMHRKPVKITAAGRTDSGVHARGQVVNFRTHLESIPDWKFRDAVNYYLPRDLSILHSERVEDDFSSRFSALRRVYKYYYYVSPVQLPFLERYAVRRDSFPDLEKLNQMASFLIGDRDFSTFAASGDMSSSKRRILYAANYFMEREFLVFKIEADSFLYRMVRSLTGTMMELHDYHKPAEEFKEILESRQRNRAGATAPAKGLFLEKVYYGKEADYYQ